MVVGGVSWLVDVFDWLLRGAREYESVYTDSVGGVPMCTQRPEEGTEYPQLPFSAYSLRKSFSGHRAPIFLARLEAESPGDLLSPLPSELGSWMGVVAP